MKTAPSVYNTFHGLKPPPKNGDITKKGDATTERDLPNVATALEALGKTEPESPAENAIHNAESDEMIGPKEKTTTELKDKIKVLVVYTADENGNHSKNHLPLPGVYAAKDEGDTAKVGEAPAKTLCVASKVGDTIGGPFCAMEPPEVCNLLNLVAALETDGEAGPGKTKCGNCETIAILKPGEAKKHTAFSLK